MAIDVHGKEIVFHFEGDPTQITEGNPSEDTENYWIYAKRKVGEYPSRTLRGGKWMIFVPNQEIDTFWAQMKQTVEEGKLGNEAKCSTAKPNKNSTNPDESAIMIYTYDGDDEEDVWKIRQALRELGVTKKIYWKADEATKAGLYTARGNTKVSRYGG